MIHHVEFQFVNSHHTRKQSAACRYSAELAAVPAIITPAMYKYYHIIGMYIGRWTSLD